jgi:hypothetical protein
MLHEVACTGWIGSRSPFTAAIGVSAVAPGTCMTGTRMGRTRVCCAAELENCPVTPDDLAKLKKEEL